MSTIRGIAVLYVVAVLVITGISSWILGFRMQRRMKRVLGRGAANEEELTSLTAWMRVEQEEERGRGGKLS